MGGSSSWRTSRRTQRQTPPQVRGRPSATPETITGGRTGLSSAGSTWLHSCGQQAEALLCKKGEREPVEGLRPQRPRTLTFQVTFQVAAAGRAGV